MKLKDIKELGTSPENHKEVSALLTTIITVILIAPSIVYFVTKATDDANLRQVKYEKRRDKIEQRAINAKKKQENEVANTKRIAEEKQAAIAEANILAEKKKIEAEKEEARFKVEQEKLKPLVKKIDSLVAAGNYSQAISLMDQNLDNIIKHKLNVSDRSYEASLFLKDFNTKMADLKRNSYFSLGDLEGTAYNGVKYPRVYSFMNKFVRANKSASKYFKNEVFRDSAWIKRASKFDSKLIAHFKKQVYSWAKKNGVR